MWKGRIRGWDTVSGCCRPCLPSIPGCPHSPRPPTAGAAACEQDKSAAAAPTAPAATTAAPVAVAESTLPKPRSPNPYIERITANPKMQEAIDDVAFFIGSKISSLIETGVPSQITAGFTAGFCMGFAIKKVRDSLPFMHTSGNSEPWPWVPVPRLDRES